jgi:hypothetical protein
MPMLLQKAFTLKASRFVSSEPISDFIVHLDLSRVMPEKRERKPGCLNLLSWWPVLKIVDGPFGRGRGR